MGVTAFPNGVSSFGVPIYGGSIPPITGTYYHVCPGISSIINAQGKQIVGSSSNSGLSLDSPLDSIATAYNKCVSGAGDGIILWSYGTTTAACTSYLTAAITWSKHGITVAGVGAPTRFNKRARVTNKSTALALANLIDVTGNNNSFYNIALYNGGTTGAGGMKITGGLRNYFENVHLMGGMGMTTPTVNDYSLYLDAAEENTFVNCTIGSDTFDKSDVAGAELFYDNLCARNRFYGCEFVSYRSAQTASPGMIKLVGAGDSIMRTEIFDNCTFQLYDDGAMPTSAAVVIGTAPNNGLIVFKDCLRIGFTDWAAAATSRVYSGSQTSAEAGGLVIAANPS